MGYRIERCRSHNVNMVPQEWELVLRGSEAEIVAAWWGTYAGVSASGDQFRVVDADGNQQMVGSVEIVGPMYP